MQNGERLSLEQIRAFMKGSQEVHFEGVNRHEVYAWMTVTICDQEYWKQHREVKGLLKRYMAKMTGLGRAQVTRLIGRYKASGTVKERRYRRHRFARHYTDEDVRLLARVDEAHEVLSGPATQKILYREFHDFGNRGYQRLAAISTAHIYNLRKRRAYRETRIVYQKTRPVQVSIGERRKPDPKGEPGYLRVDTVHQGDQDGVKGVYHINAVDEVTQWEIVGAAEHISEAWLKPVLEAMLEQFPFKIRGFHSDNGSEYINHTVVEILNKLLAEQTKSRPRHSNDNGLVEAKNGAVIRKHMGYDYIRSAHAEEIGKFYEQYFNPYLNFHRPCGVPDIEVDGKGQQRRAYRWYATPWEILRQLPDLARHLRADVTQADLQKLASAESDTEAARRMQAAKQKLFEGFRYQRSA